MNPQIRLILIVVLVWMWMHRDGITTSPAGITQVVYVYEKDDGAPPDGVEAALAQINERGIEATSEDDDAQTGTGDVPARLKVAFEAAKEFGIPLLVVQAGDRVVRTVKEPTTEQDVLEAVDG